MGFYYLFTNVDANKHSSILLNVYQTSTFISSKHHFYLFVCSIFFFINYVFMVHTKIKVLKVLILNRNFDKKKKPCLFFEWKVNQHSLLFWLWNHQRTWGTRPMHNVTQVLWKPTIFPYKYHFCLMMLLYLKTSI